MSTGTPLLLLAIAGLVVGCATEPLTIDSSHPASVDAAAALAPPARPTLAADANTRRTRELLAQREQQAGESESEIPVDEVSPSPTAPRTSPGPMQGMEGHEHH